MNVEDPEQWEEYFAWLRQHLETLYNVFSRIVRHADQGDERSLLSYVPKKEFEIVVGEDG